MTCEGCLLFTSNGGCSKLKAIAELQAKHVENKKAILFLNYQVGRLDKVHCRENFDDFEAYRQGLLKKLAWVELQPLSVLRRKFPVASFVPAAVRVHCCFKNCPDRACKVRVRGRHCPKQQKITVFGEAQVDA